MSSPAVAPANPQILKDAILTALRATETRATRVEMQRFFDVLRDTPADVLMLENIFLRIELLQELPMSDNRLRNWLASQLLLHGIDLNHPESFKPDEHFRVVYEMEFALSADEHVSKVGALNLMRKLLDNLTDLAVDDHARAVEKFEADLKRLNMHSAVLSLIDECKQDLEFNYPPKRWRSSRIR